jgi:hypothetical protein
MLKRNGSSLKSINSAATFIMAHKLQLRTIPGQFAICRLHPEDSIPPWAISGQIWSVTRTASELSVVCSQDSLPQNVEAERNWRALQVVGPLPFEMVGVLSSLLIPLMEAGVSIFALSTFETDFILVREKSFEAACQALTQAGHVIT